MALPQLRAARKFEAGIPDAKAKRKAKRELLNLATAPGPTTQRQAKLASIAKRGKAQAAIKAADLQRMLNDIRPFDGAPLALDLQRGINPHFDRRDHEHFRFRLFGGLFKAFDRRAIENLDYAAMHREFRQFADGHEVQRFLDLRRDFVRKRWAKVRTPPQLAVSGVRMHWKTVAAGDFIAPPEIRARPVVRAPQWPHVPIEAVQEDMAAVEAIVRHLFKRNGRVDQGHKAQKWKEFGPLDTLLKSLGWDFSGSGHFSVAWVKGAYSLKINFRTGDKADMYAEWAQHNSTLPGVPRVYRVSRQSGGFMVLMRRYEKFDDSPNGEHSATYRAITSASYAGGQAREGVPETRTMIAIRDAFSGSTMDMHPGNVMIDPETNRMVITDPICW